MDCRRNMIRVSEAVCLPALLALCLSGCVPGRDVEGTVDIHAAPGKLISGELFTGQTLRATVPVEASHLYAMLVAVRPSTTGSTATGDIVGSITGDALPEPVEFFVTVVSGTAVPGPTTPTLFTSVLAGDVTVEFLYPVPDTSPAAEYLDLIRALIQGPLHATFELSVTDLGFDDNGGSPADAVTLEVGIANERTGSLSPGDAADYFLVQFDAGMSYRIGVESTDAVTVVSGSEDRFGQINFGVPTLGGLIINVSSSAGVPGSFEFTALATETVLLRLTAFGGAGVDPTATTSIQYALSAVEFTPEGE